jgi:hypothetical protein
MPGQNGRFVYPSIGKKTIGCFSVGPILAGQGNRLAEFDLHLAHQLMEASAHPSIVKPALGQFPIQLP